jgi:RNA polymerase sigma-70 factor, ECF subfamily
MCCEAGLRVFHRCRQNAAAGSNGNQQVPMLLALATSMRVFGFRATSPAGLRAGGSPDVADQVARLASGDSQALAELYDQHHEAVRNFAGHMIRDAAAAEDLVHDVFVALPNAIRRYNATGSLRSFLLGMAANQARHQLRSATRRRAAGERLGREPAPASGETPEEKMTESAFLHSVNRALDRLPHALRVAFVLCEVEERSAAEVAAIVDAPEATVRTRLFHARKKLREYLAQEGVQ